MQFKQWLNESEEFDSPFLSWISPSGEIFPLSQTERYHTRKAQQITGIKNAAEARDTLLEKGFMRVTFYGKEVFINNPYKKPTSTQIKELSDLAIIGNQYDTIIYDNDETNRTVWHKMDENTLSDTEKAMLGQVKVGKSGKPSKYEHPSEEEWDSLRPFLVQKSQKRNPNLNPELTAYTPGETLNLLDHPEIAKWHKKIINYKVPNQYDTVVLVPCAASKPWGMSCKSEFYQAYHQIKNDPQYKNLFFATVSEPLGIVPQDMWEDFPQYDNPGLFDDTAMQSGLMTKDWSKSPIKTKRVMPFDTNAYDQSIDKLSNTIAKFLDNNNDKKFLAFVDHPDGSLSTHGDMLNKASKSSGVPIKRFSKKEKSGREKNQLLPFLKNKLSQ